MSERDCLLRRIQAVDFALYETVLYPMDIRAAKKRSRSIRSTATSQRLCVRNLKTNTVPSRSEAITATVIGTG